MKIKYIRWLLSLGLCVGVYFETGIFTTTFVVLTIVTSELYAALIKKMIKNKII